MALRYPLLKLWHYFTIRNYNRICWYIVRRGKDTKNLKDLHYSSFFINFVITTKNNKLNPHMYIDILSIALSLLAVIISFLALRQSKQVLSLTSKDYNPRINIKFTENGIIIANNDDNLYKIYSVGITKIVTTGYIDNIRNGDVNIPFIASSYMFLNENDYTKPLKSKFTIPYADKEHRKELLYRASYSTEMLCEISNFINNKYCIDNDEGYAAPYLKNVMYLLDFTYITVNNEEKHSLYAHYYMHGGGMQTYSIAPSEYKSIIDSAMHPAFGTCKEYLEYFAKHNFTSFE